MGSQKVISLSHNPLRRPNINVLSFHVQNSFSFNIFLSEPFVPLTCPPILWCNNIEATFLATNLVFHARTKHVEIHYHFVREWIICKQLVVRFIYFKDQLANIMTKGLYTPCFLHLWSTLTIFPAQSACHVVVDQIDRIDQALAIAHVVPTPQRLPITVHAVTTSPPTLPITVYARPTSPALLTTSPSNLSSLTNR